jgi:hypothetical protein
MLLQGCNSADEPCVMPANRGSPDIPLCKIGAQLAVKII